MVDVAPSYNMNCSTISTSLKDKDKIMEHVKSALLMMSTIILKKHGGFPHGTVVKNLPANAGDTGLSPGPGRSHMPQNN